jgi:SAM-dependent methyltransferase
MLLEHLDLASDEQYRKKARETLYKKRLFPIYDLAAQVFGPIERICDIGTNNGFAIDKLAQFACHVYTGDIDYPLLEEAQQNPDVQRLITAGRVQLMHMDGQYLPLPDNSMDGVDMIEVAGAGLKGSLEKILAESHRVLKPEGKLLFTMKSREAEHSILDQLQWNDLKGYPITRREIESMLDPSFGPISWYGNVLLPINYQGKLELPGSIHHSNGRTQFRWDDEAFIPRPAEEIEDTYINLYWTGIAVKQ